VIHLVILRKREDNQPFGDMEIWVYDNPSEAHNHGTDLQMEHDIGNIVNFDWDNYANWDVYSENVSIEVRFDVEVK